MGNVPPRRKIQEYHLRPEACYTPDECNFADGQISRSTFNKIEWLFPNFIYSPMCSTSIILIRADWNGSLQRASVPKALALPCWKISGFTDEGGRFGGVMRANADAVAMFTACRCCARRHALLTTVAIKLLPPGGRQVYVSGIASVWGFAKRQARSLLTAIIGSGPTLAYCWR